MKYLITKSSHRWHPSYSYKFAGPCMHKYLSWGGGMYLVEMTRTKKTMYTWVLLKEAGSFFTLKQRLNLLFRSTYCYFGFSSAYAINIKSSYNFIFANLKRITRAIWFHSSVMDWGEMFSEPCFIIRPPEGFLFEVQGAKHKKLFEWYFKRCLKTKVFKSKYVELPILKSFNLPDDRTLFFIEKKYKINPYQPKLDP